MGSVLSLVLQILANGGGKRQTLANAIAAAAVMYITKRSYKMGPKKVLAYVIGLLLDGVPGASGVLDTALLKDAEKTTREIFDDYDKKCRPRSIGFPKEGVPVKEVVDQLQFLQKCDVSAADGKLFAYVYTPFKKASSQLNDDAVKIFGNFNALNPSMYPSLRKMEVEVVEMCRWMTGNVEGIAGSMTAGGTESILMAIKTAREFARETKGITEPECVLCYTAHPAFAKAGHYLGVKMVWVEQDPDTQMAVLGATEAAINKNTIILVGSAPSYPCGVMDPIEGLAKMAQKHDLLMHVDACYGGFFLPWLEKIGKPVPLWDFRIPGVTSMSMDMHKFGFTAKGASTVLYRSRTLRRYQYYAFTQWPGGLFVSPSMLGTRAGGPIASAWATLQHYGQDGYMENARKLMETAEYLQKEFCKVPGIKMIGNPVMCAMGITSTDKDINLFSVADQMEERGGWKMEMNTSPPGLHFTLMPPHCEVREKLAEDFVAAVNIVKADPAKYASEGSAATYGMVAKIPDDAIVDKFMTQLLDVIYTPDDRED